MRHKPGPSQTVEQYVREIRRATRKRYSAEEKIRIVLSGLRGEHSTAEQCRREGIVDSLYYSWSKEFLEACKKRLERHHDQGPRAARHRWLRDAGAGGSNPLTPTRFSHCGAIGRPGARG